MARIAERGINQIIDAEDDLFFPLFYMAVGLDPWLGEEVMKYVQDRPYCFMDQ